MPNISHNGANFTKKFRYESLVDAPIRISFDSGAWDTNVYVWPSTVNVSPSLGCPVKTTGIVRFLTIMKTSTHSRYGKKKTVA